MIALCGKLSTQTDLHSTGEEDSPFVVIVTEVHTYDDVDDYESDMGEPIHEPGPRPWSPILCSLAPRPWSLTPPPLSPLEISPRIRGPPAVADPSRRHWQYGQPTPPARSD